MKTKILKNCKRCGKEFSAERNSAKYCGNTCKTMANRERRNQEKNDEMLRLKREGALEKRVQKAEDQAEKQRILDDDLLKLREHPIIAAKNLMLKLDQEAADKDKLNQQLEVIRQEDEKHFRLLADNKIAWDAFIRKRQLEKKSQDSIAAFKLQVSRAKLGEIIVTKIWDAFTSPKKSAITPKCKEDSE